MNNRTEGEYPFYPVKPEQMVMKPVHFMKIEDEETGYESHVIEYGHGFQNTTGFLQCGKDF